jgi:hypothetical protein
MLHNFYKYNHKPPKVKPEDYFSIEELKEFNISASPSYVPTPVKKEGSERLETR